MQDHDEADAKGFPSGQVARKGDRTTYLAGRVGPAHTPGPWTINGTAIEAEDKEQRGILIAHVFDEDDNGAAEHDANARLIAAAPELLERLKARRGGCRCAGEECPRCKADDAVIAKAEGR